MNERDIFSYRHESYFPNSFGVEAVECTQRTLFCYGILIWRVVPIDFHTKAANDG